MMAHANGGVPATTDSTAASTSSTASGWVNWRASARGQVRVVRATSEFGP